MNRLAYAFGIVGAAAAVAACGSASPSSSSASTQPAAGSANCPSPGQRFQLAAAGTVTSVDFQKDQLMVQDNRRNANSPVKVMYNPSSVNVRMGRQTVNASNLQNDLKAGDRVGIQGQPQSDGTVQATTILIRPAGAPSPGQGEVRVQGQGPGTAQGQGAVQDQGGPGGPRRAGCPPQGG